MPLRKRWPWWAVYPPVVLAAGAALIFALLMAYQAGAVHAAPQYTNTITWHCYAFPNQRTACFDSPQFQQVKHEKTAKNRHSPHLEHGQN